MKYINKYKIFESLNYIEDNLKDITLELKDLGYIIDIKFDNESMNIDLKQIVLKIYTEDSIRRGSRYWFTFTDEVRETVLRIYQYMRELGWYSNLSINSNNKSKKFYIRPDERMRTEDIIEIESNYPKVSDIQMIFIKKVTQ